MILDFIPQTGAYTLRLPRSEQDLITSLVKEHGLDFSMSASSPSEAVLFTREQYAAASFAKYGTPRALDTMRPLLAQIEASWRNSSDAHIRCPPDQELWPFQRASVQYVLGRQNTLVADQPGLGKQSPVDTPVLTPSGWRAIGDLRVGDMVFSEDGRPTSVVGVFPQGIKPSYRVIFRDGTKTECGLDHLWKVATRENRSRDGEQWRVLSLRELLAKGLTRPHGQRIGARWYVPLTEPVVHAPKELPVDPYILGVLLGDGSLRDHAVEFASCDSEIAAEVERRLPTDHRLVRREIGGVPHYAIRGASHKNYLHRALRNLGVCVTSEHKFIPPQYLLGSVEQRLDLLRGLMDTDGSCHKDCPRTAFHNTSPQLVAGVADLVRSLGGMAVEHWYDRPGRKRECSLNVKMVLCPFFLQRKVCRWKPHVFRRYIRSVEYAGDKEQVCIKVANSRGTYLANDYIVTHNTPIAICFANEIAARRVLVVCPANIRLQWVNRIRQWTTMRWPYHVYPVLSGRSGVHPSAEWTVVSYDLARTEAIGKSLAMGTYDLLVLDEAHYLKSIDAERTQAIFGDHTGYFRKPIRNEKKRITGYDTWFEALAGRCGAILALTGTPLPNRPREAYTIARGLCFDAIDWMSEDRFRERFNPSARLEGVRRDGSTYQYTREEVGRAGELQNRLRGNFMVRHMKRDVMTQLKLPVYDIVQVIETAPVKQALQAESLLDIDPDNLEGADAEVMGNWAIVRHQMGLAIAPQVCEYARMCLDGGEDKLVIGAWHKDVLDIYQRELDRFGVLRVDGSTSAGAKQQRVEEFQANPGMRVMIGNTLSLGTGTDGLQTVCNHLLLGEPDPVPGNNVQFVDRLDRGGQLRTVLADIFVAPNSLLERILARAIVKNQNTHKALDFTF